MARVKRGVHGRKHRRTVMNRAKGFRGARSRRYRVANETILHADRYATRDRRAKKRDFRKLWITRINAATRQDGLSYSRFMFGLKQAELLRASDYVQMGGMDLHEHTPTKAKAEGTAKAEASSHSANQENEKSAV